LIISLKITFRMLKFSFRVIGGTYQRLRYNPFDEEKKTHMFDLKDCH
jgi:hypothetical protein